MFVQVTIAFLAGLVAAALVGLVARAGRTAAIVSAIVIAALMTLQWSLATSGVLREWDRTPPPFMALLAVSFLLTIGLALSPIGARIAANTSIVTLVAFQMFRVPLELAMHQAAGKGIMPAQMTYTGWNFDIVTGLTAMWLTFSARPRPWSRSHSVIHDSGEGSDAGAPAGEIRAPRWVIVGWNLMGSILLLTIVAIAIASTPRIAAFGSSPERLNTWVADAPYIWLPGVLVQAALFGHIVLWRKLLR